jgi:hypothetical protein
MAQVWNDAGEASKTVDVELGGRRIQVVQDPRHTKETTGSIIWEAGLVLAK